MADMDVQRKSKIKSFLGPLILVLTGSYMLHLSWFKWPDFLIDYGRELYVPWQINQGKVLFADISHLYGPLSHYFNAFLFQIFGTGLSTLIYFNIVITILMTAIIYTLVKSSFGDFIATTAGICFLVIFAFSQYTGIANYNFVCPYSHEVTYGMFLFFLILLTVRKYLADPGPIHALLIGFLMGLVFLTKVEIFLAGFISILCGFIIIFRQPDSFLTKKHLICLIISFLFPATAFFIYFSFHMSWVDAWNAVTASYQNIFIDTLAGNIYYQHLSGLDHPSKNIVLMLKYTFDYLIFFAFAGFIAWLFARSVKKRTAYGIIIIILAFVIMMIFLGHYAISWVDVARPYPVFILLLLAYLIADLRLKRADHTYVSQHLPFTLLVMFSLLLLLKIILNVHFYHYGFALAMPAAMVMVTVLLHYIPTLISRWGNKTVVMSFSGLLIVLTILFYFNFTKHVYDTKTYPVARGRDKFFTFDAEHFNYGPVVGGTLAYLDQSMSGQDSFIVLPDGVMLNYLSRRSNPSRYFEFTPNFVEAIGEATIINDISRNRPAFIILTKKDTSEHGAKYFGVDYARNIYSWITDNYDKVHSIGDDTLSGKDFGITIMKLKNNTRH